MTPRTWWRSGMVLAGLASVVVLARAGAAPEPAAEPGTRVVSADGAEGPAVIAGPGRVEPRSEEIDVAPELSGKIAEVLVDEGDPVTAGQVIARLESGDHEARVQAAGARLQVAEAERQRLLNGARPEERREARAVAEQTQAALAHARIEVERSRRLFEGGVIPRDTLDRAERDWLVATARQREAAERWATVDADARADDLARADAAVALAKANLAEARAVLAKTIVRAPLTGVVLRRHKQAGESVALDSPSPAVVTVADLSALRVRVDVDETDVAWLGEGRRAWVTAPAYGDTRFEGHVVRVGEMLGRKNVRTGEPAEKVDTRVLETLIELAPGTRLPIGLRVDAFIVR